MHIHFLFVVVFICFAAEGAIPLSRVDLEHYGFNNDDPDVHLNSTEIIRAHGYGGEDHWVPTRDHYLINMQRITSSPRKSCPAGHKGVVIFFTGFECSSAIWLVSLPGHGTVYPMADECYDVWIHNPRGTTYSRRSSMYPDTDERFWEFSWDEMGNYDFPDVVHYVKHHTKQEKVFVVGHSQGGNMIVNGQIQHPEMVESIHMAALVAPVIYTKAPGSSLLKDLAELRVDTLLREMGMKVFLPTNAFFTNYFPKFCKIFHGIECLYPICAAFGCNSENMDPSRTAMTVAHIPAGSGIQNLQHWAQSLRTGRFAFFDYGKNENVRKYGQEENPDYDLGHINIPMAVFYGGKDPVSDPTDDEEFLTKIPREFFLGSHKLPTYAHGDFCWGINSPKLLNPYIFGYFEQFLNASN